MTKYYNPQRIRNLYDPASKKPYEISRSYIDSFLRCPRCFYLDRRLGTSTPPSFPFTLNSAVDTLLKREFDIFRELQLPHPLMTYHNIRCVPFRHKDLNSWRDSLHGGIRHLHRGTNLIIRGSLDDVWVDSNNELHVVDFKSTSKISKVSVDAEWQIGYKQQVEIYQWLLRMSGFKVSDTAYFVYVNADASRRAFEGKLEFNSEILPYRGNDSWVEPTIVSIQKCLMSDGLPNPGAECDYCAYFTSRTIHENTRRS